MATTEKRMNRYGLLGKNISYSFSQGYFTQKFNDLGLMNHSYENFDLQKIEEVKNVLNQGDIRGLNVTIPYKQEIIPFQYRCIRFSKIFGTVFKATSCPSIDIGNRRGVEGGSICAQRTWNQKHLCLP